jgi:hypothetical protein
MTETGVRPIKDVKIGDKVWSYNTQTDTNELKTVTMLHDPIIPREMNIKLIGKYGSLITSKEHPILVKRGGSWEYVLAGELKKGDIIQKFVRTEDSNQANKLAWLAGAFLGDGSSNINQKTGSRRVRLRKDNENMVSHFTNIISELSGLNTKYTLCTDKRYSVPMWDVEKIFPEKNNLTENWSYIVGELPSSKTSCIDIPHWIKNTTDKSVFMSFLAGLIDSDGNVTRNKIDISTISETMKESLIVYSSIFGIYPWYSKITVENYNKTRDMRNTGFVAKNDCYRIIYRTRDFKDYISYFNNSVKKQKIIDDIFRERKKEYSRKSLIIPQTEIMREIEYLELGKTSWHFTRKIKDTGYVGSGYYESRNKNFDHLLQYDIITDIEDNLDIPSSWKDITVQDNNNYFCGEGSFYCTHNCGIGFRVLPDDVDKLPPVQYATATRRDSKDADFVVPDSREGWVKLLGKVLKSHFYSGKSFTYSCTLLRSKGAPIKGFGGLASGPEVLCEGMTKINEILNKRAGQKVRPVDALDIMNIIGMIVVSGNVRRSALLCLGDAKDTEYLKAKRWDLGNIPNYRAYSNNSVVCNDIADILDNDDFWAGYNGNGEPYGLINLKLSQSCGRLGETQYPDPDVVGYNPCFSGETKIALADGRGYKTIKELVEEGKDVPVYSIDPETMEVSIQWGRNPRVTGENMKLLRVHFEGCHSDQYIDVTPNHKFITMDGRTVEAKDLQKGDSLPNLKNTKFNDDYRRVYMNGKYKVEHRMIKEFHDKNGFYSTYTDGVYNGCCKTHNVVVHHKDENKDNNHPDNLEITTASEHAKIHGKEYAGENNPMYGKKHKESTKKLIGEKTKERCKDPEYIKKLSESHTEEEKAESAERMKKWKRELDAKRAEEVERMAEEAGLRTTRISENEARVVKNCENCNEEFITMWSRRERAYCSQACANTKKSSVEARTKAKRELYNDKAKENLHRQVMVYKDLQQELDKVEQKDFFARCKELGIPHRFQAHSPNPFIARNWTHFKQLAKEYNHRVSYVEELDGNHTVYNITVEKNHTVGIVCKDKNSNLSGVYIFQCGEIQISDRETCCLSEVYLPNITSKEELFKCTSYLYRICKHSLTLPCVDSIETEAIVHKNMRMGIGVTGYLQASDEQRSWLSDCYNYLREFDKKYSARHGFPQSIRIATCKPSGTLSLLGNVTPGVHPGFARYYKRRIRISSESPLINLAKSHGYHVEYVQHFDGSIDHRTQIITFPCKLPDNTVLAENCTAIQQLEWVKKLQTEWSDNSVSVTVYYRKHELSEIKEWLRKNYNNSVKTVSFLLHSDHGFLQAPLEQITKEEYEDMVKSCKPIESVAGICYAEEDEGLIGQGECAGGACPLR